MDWKIELTLYVLLLATAFLALQTRNLFTAAVVTAAFSYTMALLFISMAAVDVGFTEAVVGASILGVFYIAAVFKTTRKSSD